jgi:hypothetical protein
VFLKNISANPCVRMRSFEPPKYWNHMFAFYFCRLDEFHKEMPVFQTPVFNDCNEIEQQNKLYF